MLYRISDYITKWLLQKKVIQSLDYEIYQYGIFQILMNAAEIISILILGIVFQELVAIMTFTIAFAILRVYAGGYHANAAWKCYLSTTAMILIVLSVMKIFETNIFIDIGIWCVSGMVIVSLAPVQTRNKMLDEVECVVYRKRALVVWMSENLIAIMFLLLGQWKIIESIIWGQLVVAIVMFVGRIYNKNTEGESI